ncbi:MAG: MFS transporter [Chloroflexi bacterium]|nr:MFS transporter [Chloroflexota bacterium]
MNSIEKKVIAYTASSHALCHIFELTYGAVLVGIAREFGVGLFLLGVLANVVGFAFGSTAIPAGFLADKIDERRLLTAFCLGSGIAAIGVGLAPNVQLLAIALAVLGLALGIYHPVGSAFVARATTQRGIAFGYIGMGGNLGVALGPIMAAAIAAPMDWRAPYLVFAIPALILGGLILSFSRTPVPTVLEDAAPSNGGRINGASSVLPLILILASGMTNNFVYRGIATFMPAYFGERLGFSFFNWDSLALAGAFTTFALIFGVFGQYLGGHLSERYRREVLAVITTVVTVPLFLVVGMTAGMVLMLTAIVTSFFFFMWQPVQNNLIADYTPAAWRGRLYGLSFFVNFGLGSFSATFLGYIAERSGLNWVFIAMAGLSLIGTALTVGLLVERALVKRRLQGTSEQIVDTLSK